LRAVPDPDPVFLANRMPAIATRVEQLGAREREELVALLLEIVRAGTRPLLERISAGNALGLLGDPRLDPLRPQMCAVPAGPFWMGTERAEAEALARRYGIAAAWMLKSTPLHEVELDAYEIARFPVSEGEYQAFVRDTDYWEQPSHWRDGAPPPFRSNHPVHGAGWQGALLYCEWLGERTGRQYRIPTEAEWEKAARGSDRRSFPWGERFDPGLCNTREGGVGSTTPVGTYASGASPCGALDMAGNVEEWTADLYWPYPGTDFEDPDYGSYRMTRGGVFSLDADLARCDRRHGEPFAAAIGFRVARSTPGA
jgi:formylglycine-generating enzyme required for sulfatase activity